MDMDSFDQDIKGIFIKFQNEIKLRVMTCKLVTQDSKISWKWSDEYCHMKFAWNKLKIEGCKLGGGGKGAIAYVYTAIPRNVSLQVHSLKINCVMWSSEKLMWSYIGVFEETQ